MKTRTTRMKSLRERKNPLTSLIQRIKVRSTCTFITRNLDLSPTKKSRKKFDSLSSKSVEPSPNVLRKKLKSPKLDNDTVNIPSVQASNNVLAAS
jgi:hypothetical protein